MRFVWAVVAFILAAVLIGAGVAQRTVFLGPRTHDAQIEVTGETPYVLVDGEVLGKLPGSQTLRIVGDGDVFAAYARTGDMQAWLADASYEHVTLGGDGEITTETVEPTAESDDDAAGTRDPAGSDLWLEQFQENGELTTSLKLPDEMSVLIAADGTEPAPADVSVTWPITNATPWAGPLVVAGGIALLIGLLLYVLGIRHVRRSRGPRRKSSALPPVEPGPAELEGDGAKGVISSSRRGRAITGGRRRLVALPALAVAGVLFAGCSAEAWPQFAETPSPTPTPTVVAPDDQPEPALTMGQAERILADISETVAQADEDNDADLAAQRLDGAALAVRETNYTLRAKIKDYASLGAIPASPIKILLPQAVDDWPRSALIVAQDEADETVPPSIMLVTQTDPWSDYKVQYIASLEASAQIPEVAPAWLGTTMVPPDSSFLVMPPQDVAAAYADVLNDGEDSEFHTAFNLEGDQFREAVAAKRAETLKNFNKTGEETGTLKFDATAGGYEPLSLATLQSGAIVAVSLDETDTVKPTDEDAVIKLDGDDAVRTLSGEEETSTGITTTFSDQLFFYVPGQGSDEKIQLLGYASSIFDAKVIDE